MHLGLGQPVEPHLQSWRTESALRAPRATGSGQGTGLGGWRPPNGHTCWPTQPVETACLETVQLPPPFSFTNFLWVWLVTAAAVTGTWDT